MTCTNVFTINVKFVFSFLQQTFHFAEKYTFFSINICIIQKKVVILRAKSQNMGKLAFILNFILAVFLSDATENRRNMQDL